MNKDEKNLNVLFTEDTDWMTKALEEHESRISAVKESEA